MRVVYLLVLVAALVGIAMLLRGFWREERAGWPPPSDATTKLGKLRDVSLEMVSDVLLSAGLVSVLIWLATLLLVLVGVWR